MYSHQKLLLLALALTLPAAAKAQVTQASVPPARTKPAQLPKDSMELARKYTAWFYTTQIDSVVAHLDSAQRGKPEQKAQYESRAADLAARAGTEKIVMEEKFITRNGARQYWRTAMFSNYNEPMLLRWVIGSKGEILGIGMSPLSQAPPIDPP
jgi:sugar phosphate isomerase/epimerase